MFTLNVGLNNKFGEVLVKQYKGHNLLYKNGFLKLAETNDIWYTIMGNPSFGWEGLPGLRRLKHHLTIGKHILMIVSIRIFKLSRFLSFPAPWVTLMALWDFGTEKLILQRALIGRMLEYTGSMEMIYIYDFFQTSIGGN